jgi:hypothetical protein
MMNADLAMYDAKDAGVTMPSSTRAASKDRRE